MANGEQKKLAPTAYDERKAKAAAPAGKKSRKSVKSTENVPALLQNQMPVLSNEDYMTSGPIAGSLYKLHQLDEGGNKTGLWATFRAENKDGNTVLLLEDSNEPELRNSYVGGLDWVHVNERHVGAKIYTPALDNGAGDKQAAMQAFLFTCFTQIEQSALRKKFLNIVPVGKTEVREEVATSEELGNMFAGVPDRYRINLNDNGKALQSAIDGEYNGYAIVVGHMDKAGDACLKLIFSSRNATNWVDLVHTFVKLHLLHDNPERFSSYVSPEGELDENTKMIDKVMRLGQALLAVAEAGGHTIPVTKPEPKEEFVSESNIAKHWGEATSDIGKALQSAIDGEYNGNPGIVRFGDKPNSGIVFEIKLTRGSMGTFAITPVMCGKDSALAGKVHEGVFLKIGNSRLPEDLDVISESLGKRREDVQNILRFFFNDGHTIVDALHIAHKAIEEKRAAQAARDAKKAEKKPAPVADIATARAPQYGQHKAKTPSAPVPKPQASAPVATQPASTMSEMAMKMAIDSMNGDPDKIAKFIANLNGHQAAKSA